MTSILTNVGAMAALQTLRTIDSSLQKQQAQLSSGLRIGTAADNAAYWSISTTMRSDNGAISAVTDALGLGAAKVDVAYAGMESVVDVLGEFMAKLVSAKEPGVDREKIQEELEQLKQQVESIAQSASFSGENWLSTSIPDIYDTDINGVSIVSSFTRSATGGVSVKTLDLPLSEVALFNSSGGGLLEADARDMESIAGMRLWGDTIDGEYVEQWNPDRPIAGGRAGFTFDFSGPLTFDDAGDEIRFNVTVDTDNDSTDPLSGMPGPHKAGHGSTVTINRSVVDAVYPGLNGVISTNTEYAAVLNHALDLAGSSASVRADYRNYISPGVSVHDPVTMGFYTDEDRSLGLDGSYVEVSGYTSTLGMAGGLGDDFAWGTRAGLLLTFDEFQVYKDGDNLNGVEVSFTFYHDSGTAKNYSFNRTYVNELLGKDTGKVETAAEMVTLFQSLLSTDWPGLVIEETAAGKVIIKSDPAADRISGDSTFIGFSGIKVSIEPLPTMNFRDIDIVENPKMIDGYIDYLDTATARVISGAATLGALQSRIDMQAEFAAKLSDSIESGIGRLVDADMNEVSMRLAAIETQQQLAIQALTIANSSSEGILQLYR